MVIDRRYCTDAESNDVIHLGSDHRSLTAHFPFPCAKKKGGLANNNNKKQNLYKKTRYTKALGNRRSQKILQRQHTITTAAAAHDESETLEEPHGPTATAVATYVAEIVEQRHAATTAAIANEETEIFQQHPAVKVARKEETIDSKDQELLAVIERRKKMDRQEKAQLRDISKKIKQGIRDNRRSERHQKVQNILEDTKE